MPSNSFITNQEELLSDIINDILPSTDALFFMIGYFYFSGYKKLYDEIKNKPLKILIGMDIEPSLGKGLQEIYIASSVKSGMGDEDIREKVYENYVKMLGNIDDFDTNEFKKSFLHFMEMIKAGSIEVRKTREPNHAKMYLFQKSKDHNERGNYPGVVITGSSNLSSAGLSDRHEINVILRDKNDYKSAKHIFDNLWNSSTDILNKENYELFMQKVVNKTWINEELPKPILMYLRVLKEYFDVEKPKDLKYPHDITEGVYLDFEYQKDAINKAIATIQKHNGVIIADVVGLGKSIIASTLANYLELQTIVIAPPHLMGQWRKFKRDFDFKGEIYSSGLIDRAYEDFKNYKKELLIIVDESHKYRNEATETYGYLHKLCTGNKVAILTATPFNNKAEDIFSLIKLFQIPAKSTIQTTATLSYIFRELINKEKDLKKKSAQNNGYIDDNEIEEIGRQIRNIIYPFIIRRTRLDLENIPRYKDDLQRQKISFPKVNPPILISYNLDELTDIYQWTLDQICPTDIKPEQYRTKKKGLIGARYKPVDYLKDFNKYKKQVEDEFGDFDLFLQGQRNIASFMRKMLVSRFESSMDAFKVSLNNMIDSYNGILQWIDKFSLVPIYKKGGLPDPDDLEEQIEDEADSLVQMELFQKNLTRDLFVSKARDQKIDELRAKGIWFIDYKEIKNEFRDEIERDIKLLERIRDKWFKDNHYEDKKLLEIRKHLKNAIMENPGRKIVIFSQYTDTVNHVYENIKSEFRTMKYYSGLKKDGKLNEIVRNFDAGIPEKEQENKYDILVSTDAISEGYNLHRAGIIINYDIPYNPTRVIQRVGRINRINKKVFNELFIYNCFPTYIGEEETRTKGIATLKIAIIQALLGADTKILTEDEKLQSFFADQFEKEIEETTEVSWDAKYIAFLDKFENKHPKFIKKCEEIPKRSKIHRHVDKPKGIYSFAKKGFNYIFGYINEFSEIEILKPEDGLRIFEADIHEDSEEVSKEFYDNYGKLKNYLVSQKATIELSKGEIKTIDIIELLRDKVHWKRTYMEYLLRTIKKYNGLPDYCMREIRKVKLNGDLNEEVVRLMNNIPLEYLKKIDYRAQEIENIPESIILSEEIW